MSKFTSFKSAESFRLHCINPSKWTIILGDDEKYWLCTNREASQLMNKGYELAIY